MQTADLREARAESRRKALLLHPLFGRDRTLRKDAGFIAAGDAACYREDAPFTCPTDDHIANPLALIRLPSAVHDGFRKRKTRQKVKSVCLRSRPEARFLRIAPNSFHKPRTSTSNVPAERKPQTSIVIIGRRVERASITPFSHVVPFIR